MQELSLNKRKKEMIKGLMKNISSTNNNEEILKLYQSILKIDSTNKEILLKYLLLVRHIRGVKDQNPNLVIEIFTYFNHFSPLEFNKNFVDITEKKHSSIDKLLLFFQNILSQNWGKATFDNRKKFIKFLNVTIKEDSGTINNTSPITWENEELYIFNLYKEFLEQIKKKITHYESKNIDDDVESEKIKSCKEFIEKMTNELNKPNITKRKY